MTGMPSLTNVPWRLPAALAVPLRRRRAFRADIGRHFAGEKHEPVVYFARVGRSHVKIGTTTNLQSRMLGLYLGLEDVLAVVPGNRYVESAFHQRFRTSRHDRGDSRAELFRLDWRLRLFLARRRCRWTEVAGCQGFGCAAAVLTGSFLLGVLIFATGTLVCVFQTGWER